jgi:hypothetical protein
MSGTDDTRARTLLDRVPALQRRADLDLLMFFARHPRTLMDGEQLAKLLGYDIGEVGQSLDRLLAAGLLTRLQNTPRPPRMYVFVTDATSDEWLPGFVEFASTREGRLALQRVLTRSPPGRSNGLPAQAGEEPTASARPVLVRRQAEAGEPRPDRSEREKR